MTQRDDDEKTYDENSNVARIPSDELQEAVDQGSEGLRSERTLSALTKLIGTSQALVSSLKVRGIDKLERGDELYMKFGAIRPIMENLEEALKEIQK